MAPLAPVTVEAPNFKKYEQKGIRLEVAKDVRIDARLKAGAAAESVTVTHFEALDVDPDALIATPMAEMTGPANGAGEAGRQLT